MKFGQQQPQKNEVKQDFVKLKMKKDFQNV